MDLTRLESTCAAKVSWRSSPARPVAQLAAADNGRSCAGRSSSSTSGRTPASTGCARSPTSAPGPRSTRTTGSSSSASTRRSSRSSATSTTSAGPCRRCGSSYPVAIDSDYAVWQAFDNHYWPAVYFADAEGRIRHHHFGEGGYEECERVDPAIAARGRRRGHRRRSRLRRRRRLRGAGRLGEPGVTRDLPRLRASAENFASPGGAELDEPRTYSAPDAAEAQPVGARRATGRSRAGATVLNEADGRIAFRFHARDVHLVMGPAARGHVRAVPRARRRGAARRRPRRSTSTSRATERCPSSGCYQLIRAAGPDHRPHLRDHVPRARRRGLRVHLRLAVLERV